MKTRLRKIIDSLRSSYWFVPVLMMVLAFGLWGVTSSIDRLLSRHDALPIHWLYYDEVGALRTLVLTITGTTVGVIGVVYSITMIPLTIAASQFGPRLLRNFLRDRGTQVTLGTFSATIVFCLAVLLQLRNETSRPQVSVNVALFFGLCCFLALVYFINHVAVTIQASKVVAEVSDDLLETIDREYPPADENNRMPAANNAAVSAPLSEAYAVLATHSGYAQVIDYAGLLNRAVDKDVVIQLWGEPGDFVTEGTRLALVWPAAKGSEELSEAINRAYILGVQRTLVQDVTFGINELVEVAIRALSPAINDPFTAMTCLDWLGTALCRLCSRQFPSPYRFGNDGVLRILSCPPTFGSMADAAFHQIREYGHRSGAVTLRMIHTIAKVAQCAQTQEQRAALLHHGALVERGARKGLLDQVDYQQITDAYHDLLKKVPPGDMPREA